MTRIPPGPSQSAGKPLPPGSVGGTVHDTVIKVAIELIGVGALTVMAGINDLLADLAVALIVGWALIWLYTNVGELGSLVGKIPA